MVVRRNKPKGKTFTFTRRALLKRAGTVALVTSAALAVPRWVHAEPTMPRVTLHPTWDTLLDCVGAKTYPRLGESGPARDGRDLLKEWVHGLVLQPHEPQSALLLTGRANDTRPFPQAMGLLLPAQAVVEYSFPAGYAITFRIPDLSACAHPPER